MAVFKRGDVYWFHFVWNGDHVQKSTKQSNKRVADQIEAAYRTRLAKAEVDLIEPKPVLSFSVAMNEFLAWSKEHHKARPRTYERYVISSKALLKYFKERKLDQITADLVEDYKRRRSVQKKTHRGKVTDSILRPATINRELACLKALFYFHGKSNKRLTNPVSDVEYFNEDNEHFRVLSYEGQRIYLSEASQPLRDAATLILETG